MLMALCRVNVDLPALVEAKKQGVLPAGNSLKKINPCIYIHTISFSHPLDPSFTNQHTYYIVHIDLRQ